jgi:hypothetical protein
MVRPVGLAFEPPGTTLGVGVVAFGAGVTSGIPVWLADGVAVSGFCSEVSELSLGEGAEVGGGSGHSGDPPAQPSSAQPEPAGNRAPAGRA